MSPPSSNSLTRTEFLGVLGFSLVVFGVAGEPVWRSPFELDTAIIWSYAVIPVAVLAVLTFRRRLKLKTFLLSTMEITLLKYAITICVATVFWAISEPPSPPPPPPAPPRAVRPPPAAPSVIAPESTGALSGRLLNEAGQPLPNTLVWIDSGLEDLTFAAPRAQIHIPQDARGGPPLAMHHLQPLLFDAGDGQLHTFYAKDRLGRAAFSAPMVASGRARPFVPGRPFGLVEVTCRVHEAQEPPIRLVILHHPFHARTNAEGRFSFRSVPAGELTVSTWSKGRAAKSAATVKAGARARLELRIPKKSSQAEQRVIIPKL